MHSISEDCTGKGHCADLEKCKETIQLILDGEMSGYSKEELSQKLEKCMPCFNHFHLGKCLKESLQEKLNQKEVPSELIEKIRTGIQALA